MPPVELDVVVGGSTNPLPSEHRRLAHSLATRRCNAFPAAAAELLVADLTLAERVYVHGSLHEVRGDGTAERPPRPPRRTHPMLIPCARLELNRLALRLR
jgi:hypothetical protein